MLVAEEDHEVVDRCPADLGERLGDPASRHRGVAVATEDLGSQRARERADLDVVVRCRRRCWPRRWRRSSRSSAVVTACVDARQYADPERLGRCHTSGVARTTGTGKRTSVGLVLGAGGVAGGAWHAGVLAALDDLGWDARSADLIVGTSAGSGMASILRLGVPPADLLAGSARRADERRSAPGSPPRPARRWTSRPPVVGGRIPRPAAPLLALRSLATPVEAPAVQGHGRPAPARAGVDRLHRRPHPAHPRPALARPSRRGSARSACPTASGWCSAATSTTPTSPPRSRRRRRSPGFFAPVVHGGETYVDGGVHSPTNADLVAGLGFDIVVVSSPMSATRSAIRRPAWSGARALHAATLGPRGRGRSAPPARRCSCCNRAPRWSTSPGSTRWTCPVVPTSHG